VTSFRWRILAWAWVAALLPHGAAAQDEPGTVAAHGTYILDEYNVDLSTAGDSSRLAAGLGFGTAYPNGWWWTAGPRVSYVRWSVDIPQQYGLGLGGAFGVGWRPDNTASPYVGVTLDRDFNVGGFFDWQMTVYAGARIRVTQNPREYFSMTFGAYYAGVFGGDGPGGNDVGIAVLYSAALFAKHR
jgi:hypothetical protein